MNSDEVWTLVKAEVEALFLPWGDAVDTCLDPHTAALCRVFAVAAFRLGQDHAADRMEKAVGSGG